MNLSSRKLNKATLYGSLFVEGGKAKEMIDSPRPPGPSSILK